MDVSATMIEGLIDLLQGLNEQQDQWNPSEMVQSYESGIDVSTSHSLPPKVAGDRPLWTPWRLGPNHSLIGNRYLGSNEINGTLPNWPNLQNIRIM